MVVERSDGGSIWHPSNIYAARRTGRHRRRITSGPPASEFPVILLDPEYFAGVEDKSLAGGSCLVNLDIGLLKSITNVSTIPHRQPSDPLYTH
jgi:hypothetical protein